MPKKHISGPYIVDPAFDKEADINKNIDEIRELFSHILDHIDQLSDDILQCLCMFSVVDCFAQEWAEYPSHGNSKAFCDFVMRFQDRYDFFSKIEPITLYYCVETIIEKTVLFPGMDPEPVVNVDDIGIIEPFTKVVDSKFSKDLLAYIQQNCDEKLCSRLFKEHSVVRLLYQMRSKIVHELSGLGSENKWDKNDKKVEPYYRDMGRMYVYDGNVISDDVYELVFPVSFIRSLAENCIYNYLDICMIEHRYPFSREWPKRNMTLCWYDTILQENGTLG